MTSYRLERQGDHALAFRDGLLISLGGFPVRLPWLSAAAILADHLQLGEEEQKRIGSAEQPRTKAGKRVKRLTDDFAIVALERAKGKDGFVMHSAQLDAYLALAPQAWTEGDLVWFRDDLGHWLAGHIQAVDRTGKENVYDCLAAGNQGEFIEAREKAGKLRHRDKAQAGRDRPRKVKR